MTETEVADYARLNVKTLQKWRRLGGGPPFVKMGASVRYRRADVEAWLTECTRHGGGAA